MKLKISSLNKQLLAGLRETAPLLGAELSADSGKELTAEENIVILATGNICRICAVFLTLYCVSSS